MNGRPAWASVGSHQGLSCEPSRPLPASYDAEGPHSVERRVFLLTPPSSKGNRFEALLNGDEIFPAMLSAIPWCSLTLQRKPKNDRTATTMTIAPTM